MQYYFDSNNENAVALISFQLNSILSNLYDINQPLIVLCIGSDRSTGDSLGPMIGHLLNKKKNKCFFVFGDLDNPVHAANLEYYISLIHVTFDNPFIISIDASLGKNSHVGYITINEGPLRPGLGVKKRLPEVGNISITGIVNSSINTNYSVLQTTRLSVIIKLAEIIANSLNSINVDFYKQPMLEILYQQNRSS